jgi:hypothetical protein
LLNKKTKDAAQRREEGRGGEGSVRIQGLWSVKSTAPATQKKEKKKKKASFAKKIQR